MDRASIERLILRRDAAGTGGAAQELLTLLSDPFATAVCLSSPLQEYRNDLENDLS